MVSPRALIAALDAGRFQQVFGASPKKLREEVFRRAGIRTRSDAFALPSAGKNEQRTQKLHAALQRGEGPFNDELAEELIRNYLYTLRPMLAVALDYFKVPHDNGLTDADLDFVAKLSPEEGRRLRDQLADRFEPSDVDLYLAYMNIPVGQ